MTRSIFTRSVSAAALLARTGLALCAIALAASSGSDSAYAYGTENDWMSNAFGGSGRAAETSSRVRSERRTTRQPSLPSLNSSGGQSSGVASYYWQPQRLASGGWFNPNAMTAAHKTLPFGTRVRVTNLNNGRAATVTINDRGPYVAGRVIDRSSAAAGVVGMKGSGVARVKLDILGR